MGFYVFIQLKSNDTTIYWNIISIAIYLDISLCIGQIGLILYNEIVT